MVEKCSENITNMVEKCSENITNMVEKCSENITNYTDFVKAFLTFRNVFRFFAGHIKM
jgi:hypothetical protein